MIKSILLIKVDFKKNNNKASSIFKFLKKNNYVY